MFAEQLDDHLDELAHHYSRSTNTGKALSYLYLAASQCAMLTAYLQALTYLNRGLELLQSLPEGPERARQELALQIARGESLYPTQGWAAPEAGRAFGRARELCVRFGDNAQLFSILYGLRLFYRYRLELQTSRQLEEQMVSIAEEFNDPAKLARAHGAVGTSLLFMGEFVAAQGHFERVRGPTGSIEGGLLLEARDYDQMAASLSFLAWDLAILGFFDQAMKVSQQVLAWAEGLSRPFTLALALLFAGLLDQFRGDVQAAQDHSASALGIAGDYGLSGVMNATVIQGWLRSCLGAGESGIAEMRRGIAGAEATGMRTPSYLLVPLAEAYVSIGRTDEAGRLLAEALETTHQTDQRMPKPAFVGLSKSLVVRAPNGGNCMRR
jgi:tetratricopeptide (TPR) repeat protein